MQSTPIPNGQIAGSVLLYVKPEPLSIEQHGRLGLNRSDHPFGFARTASAVPLQVTEFGPASLTYPIIFAGEQLAPLAIMSLRQNENQFISNDGAFDPVTYVPAFIRRYPFVLANNEDDPNMIVCLDRAAPSLAEGGDVPLFENGQPSDFTKQAIKFCGDFETERQRTDQFVQSLKTLDLFESKQATFTPSNEDGSPGQPIQLADYFAISEDKLSKLPDATLVELNRTGGLRQIHAHLNSMLNWERLIAKAAGPPIGAGAGSRAIN